MNIWIACWRLNLWKSIFSPLLVTTHHIDICPTGENMIITWAKRKMECMFIQNAWRFIFNEPNNQKKLEDDQNRDARPSAVAKPMPEFAPVTMQFFPSTLICISSCWNFLEWSLKIRVYLKKNKPGCQEILSYYFKLWWAQYWLLWSLLKTNIAQELEKIHADKNT